MTNPTSSTTDTVEESSMENQHHLIPGYRDLTQQEIDVIAEIKKNGNDLGEAIEVISQMPDVDNRALALARTNLQQGFMWLIRAVARPQGFC